MHIDQPSATLVYISLKIEHFKFKKKISLNSWFVLLISILWSFTDDIGWWNPEASERIYILNLWWMKS